MTISRAKASLGISSQHYTSEEISHLLSIKPSRVNEIGTPASKHSPAMRLRTATLWILEAPVDQNKEIDEHILWLVAFLESKLNSFEEVLKNSSASISCFYVQEDDQGGFALSSELCQRLGKLGLGIAFDIYCGTSI